MKKFLPIGLAFGILLQTGCMGRPLEGTTVSDPAPPAVTSYSEKEEGEAASAVESGSETPSASTPSLTVGPEVDLSSFDIIAFHYEPMDYKYQFELTIEQQNELLSLLQAGKWRKADMEELPQHGLSCFLTAKSSDSTLMVCPWEEGETQITIIGIRPVNSEDGDGDAYFAPFEVSGDVKRFMERFSAEKEEAKLRDKHKFFQELLENSESVKENDGYIFRTDEDGLTGQFLTSIENKEEDRLIGRMAGSTVPFVYEISYSPAIGIQALFYNDYSGIKGYSVTDIYEHPLFYHFTNNKGLHFSIPKADYIFSEKISIEGYTVGEDLNSGEDVSRTITAQQAIETVMEVDRSLDAYRGSIPGGSLNLYGIIVPETVTPSPDMPKYGKITDAVFIDDVRYYKVEIFQNQEDIDAGDIYYIAADGSTIFSESMVAGELTPIGYKGVKHLQLN